MKSVSMKLSFKELFILEHALKEYVKRGCITDKDAFDENMLLDRINNNIKCIKW